MKKAMKVVKPDFEKELAGQFVANLGFVGQIKEIKKTDKDRYLVTFDKAIGEMLTVLPTDTEVTISADQLETLEVITPDYFDMILEDLQLDDEK